MLNIITLIKIWFVQLIRKNPWVANSMLKKYFILYGAEKAFLNFQVIFFEKIQTKSQINCKFSKKKIYINAISSLIQIHTKREQFFTELKERTISLIPT